MQNQDEEVNRREQEDSANNISSVTAPAGDAGEVRALLSRHKPSLLHELGSTELLAVLVRRGVLGEADLCALQAESPSGENGGAHFDIDLFVELIQTKGFEAFREFCFALESECPHVLNDLLVDQNVLSGIYFDIFFNFLSLVLFFYIN